MSCTLHPPPHRVAASFVSQLLVTNEEGRTNFNVPPFLLTYLSTSVFTIFLPLVQIKSLLQETWLLRSAHSRKRHSTAQLSTAWEFTARLSTTQHRAQHRVQHGRADGQRDRWTALGVHMEFPSELGPHEGPAPHSAQHYHRLLALSIKQTHSRAAAAAAFGCAGHHSQAQQQPRVNRRVFCGARI